MLLGCSWGLCGVCGVADNGNCVWRGLVECGVTWSASGYVEDPGVRHVPVGWPIPGAQRGYFLPWLVEGRNVALNVYLSVSPLHLCLIQASGSLKGLSTSVR